MPKAWGLLYLAAEAMRIRSIAVLIDGAFFLKRLPRVVEERFRDSPEAVAESACVLCKRHVQRLIDEPPNEARSRWLDHVYRLFYYDAAPYEGASHHPVLNVRIDFNRTPQAIFRRALFDELRRKRKFALRLGKVVRESDWQISPKLTKPLLRTREWISILESSLQDQVSSSDAIPEKRIAELSQLTDVWRSVEKDGVSLGLRQKGVDMRIGLDIASITLKKQADTIILVSGDSDFVSAAKLARREGVEFILDPMRQRISDDLFEHIDGLFSPFGRSDTDTGEAADHD